jgi:uncharacterized protein YjbI with pentapeptide repeats
MANDQHVAVLKQGAAAWNAWREENRDIPPNLIGADLTGAPLAGAHLYEANLTGAILQIANLTGTKLQMAKLVRADLRVANLTRANLAGAHLTEANLYEANLYEATLRRANLGGANLSGAILTEANLGGANLSGAILTEADLYKANLTGANLSGANLVRADLRVANLTGANLNGAHLNGARVQSATLVDTDLTGADLTACHIYGVSAWGLKLEEAKQQNLVITPQDQPEITVDNIEVAQFIYLLLHNQKIRDVIDTIGRKAVLILGRFTDERKAVLDALREELRHRDYLPILFDFDKPASQDLTATVSTLAHLARFIIADLTDPSSIPYELATVVPTAPVPVQPIILSGCSEFAMFRDLRRRHHWVLTTHSYDSQQQLIAELGEKVIRPAELKVSELRSST